MRYMKYLKFHLFSTLVFSYLLPLPALASVVVGINIPGHEGNTYNDYWDYINTLYAFSMKIGIGLATLMIIYAGYRYITSQGNPSAINEAKDIIIGSLTGLAMLFLVYFILRITGLK